MGTFVTSVGGNIHLASAVFRCTMLAGCHYYRRGRQNSSTLTQTVVSSEALLLADQHIIQSEWKVPATVDLLLYIATLVSHRRFNQPMDNVALPPSLLRLSFDQEFDQGMDNVALPNGLQMLEFDGHFNQSLDHVRLPDSLQFLLFGDAFNQSLDNTVLPDRLQSLIFGQRFNQSLDNTTLPRGLQHLTFHRNYGWGLVDAAVPYGARLYGYMGERVYDSE